MQIEKLGPYRIGKQIGKGGMGAVYEATYEAPGKHHGMRVAVKALIPQLAAAEGFRERFEAEIDSLKKLKHDGIVSLYGYGEQDGILYYSMDLVEGSSLEQELSAGRRFDWRETVDIGIQVCRALKHAHDHGVVHRDIKPANLLLAHDGHIKIADFGIARLFGSTQLTTAGGVLGTADYMSPEQADGQIVSDKCDQYSLGGVMYALLSGRPPFKARTMPEMLQMQRFAEPEPVKRYSPGTPDQLDQLISQLLAKDPADRFPNVLVLARHMEAMKKALSRPVKPEENLDETQVGSPRLDSSSEATAEFLEDLTQVAGAPILFPNDGETDEAMQELFDAPTLAESSEPAGKKNQPAVSTATLPPEQPKQRFTSVEEEARREREQARGGRFWLVAQLMAIAATLGMLVWGGWVLMKPPTADVLYEKILSEIDQRGIDSLRVVEAELKDFLARFPGDRRANEIQQYSQQLSFQRFERKARIRPRSGGSEGDSPVESIYLSALSLAEHDPARSLQMLRSLLALYDPTNESAGEMLADGNPQKNQHSLWLALARKQIEKLAAQVQQQADTQLPVLHQRLAVAAKLHPTHPEQAVALAQAIVDLYAGQPWAQEVVAEATQMLTDEFSSLPNER